MRLAVCGLGKLGSCIAAALAEAGHEVIGVDPAIWRMPDEPGLADLLDSLDTPPTQTADYTQIAGCEASLIVVPTPSRPDGSFASEYVLDAVRSIVHATRNTNHLIIVCSTVSPGTMAGVIRSAADRHRLAYWPSFIALGNVLADLAHPDLILIGAELPETHKAVAEIASTIAPDAPIAMLTLTEAEIVKIGVNSFITMKATWANLIAEACEGAGADPHAVLDTIGGDSRIGRKFLRPGGPVGGPCLPRDSKALARFLAENDVPTSVPTAVQRAIEHDTTRAIARLLPYRHVAVLGLSYKPDTAITDNSYGLAVAYGLHVAGVDVVCHDPKAKPVGIPMAITPEAAVYSAHAVLIATPHEMYRGLDLGDRVVIDPWGMAKAG